MGFSVGGMAAALNGFQQGQDEAVARQARKDDLAFQATQRKRQLDEQQRDDTLRTSNAAIPTTKQVDAGVDPNAVAPGGSSFGSDLGRDDPSAGDQNAAAAPALPRSTKTAPTLEDEQLRSMAENYRKAGKTDQYLALTKQADEIGAKRAATNFAQLQASAPNMTTEQVLMQAQKIFDNDPFAGQVKDWRVGGDGTVSVRVLNKQTGQESTQTYKDKDALMASLQSFYSPATYQAILQKQAEERAKVHDLGPGHTLVQDGKPIAFNEANGQYVTGPDGKPVWQAFPKGAGGAGATGVGRNGKTPQTVYDEAGKILDSTLKGTPEQIAAGHALKDQLLQDYPGMGAGQVAKLATQALLNPQSVQPKFDVKSGTFVDAVSDGTQSFVLSSSRPDIKTVSQRLGGDDKARALVQQSFAQVPPPVLADVQKGAADPAYATQRAQAIATAGGNGQAYLNLVQAFQFAGKKTGVGGLVQAAVDAFKGGNQPAPAAVQQGTQPAAPPAAASPAPAAGTQPAPLPPTVGADIASRTAATRANDQQQRTQQSSQQLDTMFAEDARRKAAAREVAGLTPDVIRSMTPQEATRTLGRYETSLSPQQVSALRDVAASAQRPAAVATPR